METPEQLQAMFEALLAQLGAGTEGEAPSAEAIEEALGSDVLADIGRDEYVAALDGAMDTYDVPAEVRPDIYDELDSGGYSEGELRDHFRALFQNEAVTNAVDNSITVEGGGGGYDDHGYGTEVHDITQHNVTNQATASGDGAIAGDVQEGQFQTGEGVQVGDYNSGVVNQGDNSGQQAGGSATGGDFTTGDGNFDNSGHIGNSAIAFGGGSAENRTDQSYDGSINDSYNDDNVGNINDSYNEDNVGNTDIVTEHSHEENLEANLTVDDSFKADIDGYDDHDHDHHDYELDH